MCRSAGDCVSRERVCNSLRPVPMAAFMASWRAVAWVRAIIARLTPRYRAVTMDASMQLI